MSTSAFFTPAEEVIQREADLDKDEITPQFEQIWSATLLKICWGWIRHNGYKRVCLQFPDHYLPHSNEISDSLKALFKSEGETTDIKFFVLADTSYGSCCVDEIAAGHVEADSLIHFGNACRSRVSRLPVLYMYPQYPFDIQQFMDKLSTIAEIVNGKILYIYLDIGYHHLLDKRVDEAEEDSLSYKLKEKLLCKNMFVEAYPPAEDAIEQKLPSDPICLFVGSENARFSNLSLTTKASQWFIYDSLRSCLYEKNPLTAQYIRRRYYYIEKCKDAQTLGLIVATLTADGYLKIVSHLQEMAKTRGIKTQIISVGRINPAKLANFLEIDCFVLIGCPFNNVYNSKDYYKPIVSVFEAEMALNPAWHMKYPDTYVTDFKKLLPEGEKFLAFNPADSQELDVSLVSGRVRGNNTDNVEEEGAAAALSEQQQSILGKGKMEMMTTNTGLTFEDRTWKGLDPALGCTEPAKLEKGLSGIPTNYTHE